MGRQIDLINDDMIKRDYFIKVDFRRKLVMSILKNKYTSIYTKYLLFKPIRRQSLHFSMTEQRNRCRVSGRSHFVLSKAGLARIPFKFFSGSGLMNGISRRGR